jgi:hypothetical protein
MMPEFLIGLNAGVILGVIFGAAGVVALATYAPDGLRAILAMVRK